MQVFWRGKVSALGRNQDDLFRLIMGLLNALVCQCLYF